MLYPTIVLLEGLGKLKNSLTCDLPACSIVPQPSMLLQAPSSVIGTYILFREPSEVRILLYVVVFVYAFKYNIWILMR
jgi:hypothetical protein